MAVWITFIPNIETYQALLPAFTSFPSLRRDQRYKWNGRLCNLLNIEFAFPFLSEMCFYLPVSARGTGPEWKHPSLVTYLRGISCSRHLDRNSLIPSWEVKVKYQFWFCFPILESEGNVNLKAFRVSVNYSLFSPYFMIKYLCPDSLKSWIIYLPLWSAKNRAQHIDTSVNPKSK